MRTKKIILTCAALVFSGILVNEIIFSEKQEFNYCRETRQDQKELLEADRVTEKPVFKNIKFPMPSEYALESSIFTSALHVLYLVYLSNFIITGGSSYVSELPERAPPIIS